MIHKWEIVSKYFIRRLKASIGHPVRKRGQLHTDRFWTVPLRTPKLHYFLVHVTEFVKHTNYWDVFSEEGFEHLQQQSKYIRSQHSHNLLTGSQICRNLYFS